jgi:hypothetical protein
VQEIKFMLMKGRMKEKERVRNILKSKDKRRDSKVKTHND